MTEGLREEQECDMKSLMDPLKRTSAANWRFVAGDRQPTAQSHPHHWERVPVST